MNRTDPSEPNQAAIRGVVWGVVAAAHLLGLMVAMVPAAYWQPRLADAGSRDEALQWRFLPSPRTQPLPSNPAAAPTRPVIPGVKAHRSAHVDRSAPIARPTSPALNLTLPSQASGYAAGGADFQGQLENASRGLPVTRLPGSAVPLVAGMPFVDPKMRGFAGIARTLQHLFGVPNRHCIDVDVWRNMTRQERLKRHISTAEVDRVAAKNGCLQAPVPRRSAGIDP